MRLGGLGLLPRVTGYGDPSGKLSGGPAFVPTDLAGLTLWLKADAGTYQAAAGAAATVTNDPVGQWQDQSGNNRHFAEADPNNKPTLQLNQINGKPALRFDGTNDSLASGLALSNFIANISYEMYVVANFAGIGTNAANTYDNDPIIADTDGYFGLFAKSAGPTAMAYNWDGTDDHSDKTIATGTFYAFHQRHQLGNLILSLNNGAETTTASGATSVITGTVNLGVKVVPVAPFAQIDVSEIIIYNVVNAAGDRTKLFTYINTRYGL